MPSSTPKQAKFMRAVAHNKAFAKEVNVPQDVGRDFVAADSKASTPTPRNKHMAKRKEAGLTNTAVAKEFGVHKSTVGRALKQGYTKV